MAQQHTSAGPRSLYCYTDPQTPQRGGVPLVIADLDQYLLERQAPSLLLR